MQYSSVDWYEVVKEVIENDSGKNNQKILRAFEHIENLNINKALNEIEELNEIQYFFIILLLSIKWIKNDGGKEELRNFIIPLREKVPVNSVRGSCSTPILKSWVSIVGIHLDTDDIVSLNDYFIGDSLISEVIEEHCKTGTYSEAIPLAYRLNHDFPETRADSWAKIVSGMVYDPFAYDYIDELASIGLARPMVAEGHQEAYAHGVAIKTFCAMGLDSDHPCVQKSVKNLSFISYSKKYGLESSYGVFLAIVSSAWRAGETNHDGWFAIAESLFASLVEPHLKNSANFALTLSKFSRSKVDISYLKKHSKFIGIEWEGQYPDISQLYKHLVDEREKACYDEYMLARSVIKGEDVKDKVEERLLLKELPHNVYRKELKVFVMGCKLCLPDNHLAQLLEQVPEKEKKSALVEGAAYGFSAQPHRAISYLLGAYPEGDDIGSFTEQLLPILTPDLIDQAQQFHSKMGNNSALIAFIFHHFEKNELSKVANLANDLGNPTSCDDWVPFYKRGNNAKRPIFTVCEKSSLPIGPCKSQNIEAIDSDLLVKSCKTAQDLYQLLKKHPENEGLRASIQKSMSLKKFQKTIVQRCDLIEVALLLDDIDFATDLLPSVNNGKYRPNGIQNGVQPIQSILAYLVNSKKFVSQDLYFSLLKAMQVNHPYSLFYGYFSLSQLIFQTDSKGQEKLIDEVIETISRNFRDVSYCALGYFGFVRGMIQNSSKENLETKTVEQYLGNIPGLLASVREHEFTFFIPQQLAELKTKLPEALWKDSASKILKAYFASSEGHLLSNLHTLEVSYRQLWAVNDFSVIESLINSGELDSTLEASIKRSMWEDIDFAPNPFELIYKIRPNADNEVLIEEYLKAVTWTLNKFEHIDSKKVSRLLD
ncbi:hypothetical protein VIBNISOn1_570011 [Vibrio nigripulchritudo SOn1]|uniref:Uncharacterized protein n=1 Tax=Vibrio nigripulchritudo SOn1 TaxID=1238450 RepID=A0AAV2VVI0_9VIBR|nr:hypothetical protein [Vibrio nigripulchritudo]CCO48621.1 hypothetical protein VIBNISOn1_570011 [Vibrio nigripulchritudo SOn1]